MPPALPHSALSGLIQPEGRSMAWFKTCQFQVTPEISKALMVKEFLV
jgi:hypothetical protein